MNTFVQLGCAELAWKCTKKVKELQRKPVLHNLILTMSMVLEYC